MMSCTSLPLSFLTIVHCGQIPLPLDFGVEVEGNARFYQTCLAQTFRHFNSINKEPEMLSVINQTYTGETTDQWETAHIASYTGQWDHTHEILQRVGYDTQIDAQFIDKIRGEREFDHFQRYWDEGPVPFPFHSFFPGLAVTDPIDSIPYFRHYVDHIRSRKPKNRMYLTWQSQVTHVLPPSESGMVGEKLSALHNR